MASAGQIRRSVLYSGHVQGVGFRYTTQRLARAFTVTGYVRNTRDGRVELVAEGSVDEVERFLAAVEEAMSGHIRDRQADHSPATGGFANFEVRF